MAFIEFDLLEDTVDQYPDFRYDVFTDLFGKNLKPYVGADGVPRIGAGIDLRVYVEYAAKAMIGGAPDAGLLADLTDVVGKNYGKNDDDKLISRLNKVMSDWADSHPGFPDKFQFTGDAQAKVALSFSLATLESELADWGDVGIPLSEERAVVASIYVQGYDIEDIMDAMILDGDRTAAWMEIRYLDRNGPNAKLSKGEVAERYYQSGRFELYNDPGDVTFEEALDAGLGYRTWRKTALEYEKDFNPEKFGMGPKKHGGHDTIADFLQPAIGVVAKEYFAQIGHADELLFINGNRGGIFYGDVPGDAFNSKKNDDDLIVSRNLTIQSESIVGGAGNDVIISLAGNDRVEGGKGNDNLYGGEGNDKLFGGTGNDKLWGGGGTDTLAGGGGNDTYFLGGDEELDPIADDNDGGNPSLIGANNTDKIVEAGNGGMDTVVVQVNNGNFNLRNVERFKMAADISGSLTLKLNEFNSITLSGGDDDLTLVINRLNKTPIDIKTGGGTDIVHIEFDDSVDPSQVLDGKGLTARFKFTDLSANDTIDLTSIGIKDIIMNRDHVDIDKGYYLLAPGAKLDLMDGNKIDKTYNNYTDNWFVVKLGDNTPYGPEFIGNIDKTHFDI